MSPIRWVFRRGDCGLWRVIQSLQTYTALAVSVGHVLARMKRGYSFGQYATWYAPCARLCLTSPYTDLLVGFCGESEEEFADILRALPELRFDNAFTFAYSERLIPSPRAPCPTTFPPR